MAVVRGSAKYPDIQGSVEFFPAGSGTWVRADISGLPSSKEPCSGRFFGFHIHAGGSCSGTASEPFANALGHYNPADCPHPNHAGDLPPLLGADGHAFTIFLTNRFVVDDIIGKTVIIHANPDDFHTQPSGNAGEMMACGEIVAI